MKKRRTWILILFGVGVLVVFVGLGAIFAITVWVQQNLNVSEMAPERADAEFDTVRQRFAPHGPLLHLRDGTPIYNPERTAAAPATPTPLETMHILAWDPHDRQLAAIDVPFWILRLKSGPIEFSTYASGLDANGVRLTAEDLERYGPGIMLDTASPGGERVLVWVQ